MTAPRRTSAPTATPRCTQITTSRRRAWATRSLPIGKCATVKLRSTPTQRGARMPASRTVRRSVALAPTATHTSTQQLLRRARRRAPTRSRTGHHFLGTFARSTHQVLASTIRNDSMEPWALATAPWARARLRATRQGAQRASRQQGLQGQRPTSRISIRFRGW